MTPAGDLIREDPSNITAKGTLHGKLSHFVDSSL
jgi:hypothetical protein